MAARRSNLAPRRESEAAPPKQRAPMVSLADESEHAPRLSPARALQARLTVATAAADAVASDRWSARATLLFVVAVCGSFWAAMGSALLVALR